MAWYAYFARNTRLGIVLILPGAAFLTFFIGCAPAPFERRHSGTENNRKAVQYFIDRLSKAGLSCTTDTWTVINYSAPVELQNGICRLAGKDSREIAVIAHHDQSPATVQGADNDASGMAILISLAEVFAKVFPWIT